MKAHTWLDDLQNGKRAAGACRNELFAIANQLDDVGLNKLATRIHDIAVELGGAIKMTEEGISAAVRDKVQSAEIASSTMLGAVLAVASKVV